MPFPACLLQRSIGQQGVAFHSGVPEIEADFSTNLALIEYVLGLRAPLTIGEDKSETTEHLDDAGGGNDAEMAEPNALVVRRKPASRRVFRYEHLGEEKTVFHGVPEGPESWQQFFSDSQVAKLVTPRLAIFSAYDHEKRTPRLGRFQLCYKSTMPGAVDARFSLFAVLACKSWPLRIWRPSMISLCW